MENDSIKLFLGNDNRKKHNELFDRIEESISRINDIDSKVHVNSESIQSEKKIFEQKATALGENITRLEEENKEQYRKILEEVVFKKEYQDFIEKELPLNRQQIEDRLQGFKEDIFKKLKDLDEEIQKNNKTNLILEEENLEKDAKEFELKKELIEEMEGLKKVLRNFDHKIENVKEDIIEIRRVYYASFEGLKQENAVVNEKILECEKSSRAILESIGLQEERLKNWLSYEEERENSSLMGSNQKIETIQQQVREVNTKIEMLDEMVNEMKEEFIALGRDKCSQEESTTAKVPIFNAMKEVTKKFFNTNNENHKQYSNKENRHQTNTNGKAFKAEPNLSKKVYWNLCIYY